MVSRNPEMPSTSKKPQSLFSKILQENIAKNLSIINSHYLLLQPMLAEHLLCVDTIPFAGIHQWAKQTKVPDFSELLSEQ